MKYLFALTALALSACGGSNQSPSSSTQESTEPAKTFNLKETAIADGVEITVTAVKQAKQVVPAIAAPPAGPDETFVVVNYKMKNTGREPIDLFNRPALELVDGQGQAYSQDEVATTYLQVSNDATSAANDINPGITVSLTLVWKVAKKDFDPATWKVIAKTSPELEFKLN
jgi:hypothetical protein